MSSGLEALGHIAFHLGGSLLSSTARLIIRHADDLRPSNNSKSACPRTPHPEEPISYFGRYSLPTYATGTHSPLYANDGPLVINEEDRREEPLVEVGDSYHTNSKHNTSSRLFHSHSCATRERGHDSLDTLVHRAPALPHITSAPAILISTNTPPAAGSSTLSRTGASTLSPQLPTAPNHQGVLAVSSQLPPAQNHDDDDDDDDDYLNKLINSKFPKPAASSPIPSSTAPFQRAQSNRSTNTYGGPSYR